MASEVIWHVSRDATALEGREKPEREPPLATESEVKEPQDHGSEGKELEAQGPKVSETQAPDANTPKAHASAKRRRGRPRKGEEAPRPEPTRIEKQRTQTLEQALKELPTACDKGTKKNAQGNSDSWIGYKLPTDVTEHGLPLSVFTTSASLHDSPIAIPLIRCTRGRVGTVFYELMDAAYDAGGIWAEVREAGSTPILDRNKRNGPPPPPMEPDRAHPNKGRSASERFNSDLKDNHGGRTVRVRGHAKVHCHLMFGVLAIFAKMLLGTVT